MPTTKLTKADQSQIRSLMQDSRWDAVAKFYGLKLDQWRSELISGANAFEELRALHNRDGRVSGLTEFMDQLERQAFED